MIAAAGEFTGLLQDPAGQHGFAKITFILLFVKQYLIHRLQLAEGKACRQ